MQPVPRSNPLEEVFDLHQHSTVVPIAPPASTEAFPAVTTGRYDEKDQAIELELTNVHAEAMAIAAEMKSQMSFADPRALPRMGEVSIQALNTALDAVRQKADIKKHKDKLLTGAGADLTQNVTNNTLIIDRSALLDRIMAGEL